MIRRVALGLWLMLAMAGLPTLAPAQDGTGESESESAEIRRLVADALDGLFLDPQGRPRLTRRGAIAVEPREDGYAVALPPLDLRTPGGVTLLIDPITLTLERQSGEAFAGDLELPATSQVRGPTGALIGTLTAGTLAGSVRLSLRYDAVMELTIDAEDLRLAVSAADGAGTAGTGGTLVLETAGLRRSLHPQPDGRVDTLSRLSGRGLDARGLGEPAGARIAAGRFQLSTGRSGLALRDWLALRNSLLDRLAGSDEADAPFAHTALSEIAAELPPLFDGAYGSLTVDDLVIHDGLDRLTEERLEAVFSINDLRAATARGRFRLESLALGIDRPSEAETPPPLSLQASLAFSDSPARAVYDRLLALFVLGSEDGADPAGLPALLAALSEGHVAIETFRIQADSVGVELEGRIDPAPGSRLGLTAEAALRVTGFESLIGEVADMPDGWSISAALTVVQALGRQEQTDTGETARHYDLAIGPDGTIDLNGTDLMPLIGGLLGPDWPSRRP